MQMHRVTEKELQAFLKNPLDLLGKQFVLKVKGQKEDLLYEVVKFGASKGEGHRYGVQFSNCDGVSVEMDSDEMRKQLWESYLIDS